METKKHIIVEWQNKEWGTKWQPVLEGYWDGIGKIPCASNVEAGKILLRRYRQRRPEHEYRLSDLKDYAKIGRIEKR